MESEKINKNSLKLQIQSLRSGNRSTIIATLKEVRSTGNASILTELFDLLLDLEDEQVIGEITSLLNDLKDKDAAAILAEAIGNPEYVKLSTILVAACWQNRLSYGKYIDTFVEVAITGEYTTAIEAFSVIEEAAGDLEQDQRERLGIIIKSRLHEVDNQKKLLLKELIKVIANY
ncbi:MAG: hypothetical protein KAR19_03825 [Bacteroidales bacterium]|nr:hypothetical protein [Bacteroidales bacterium]